jgi:hypothetical protein
MTDFMIDTFQLKNARACCSRMDRRLCTRQAALYRMSDPACKRAEYAGSARFQECRQPGSQMRRELSAQSWEVTPDVVNTRFARYGTHR